jgi:hypothetical protein
MIPHILIFLHGTMDMNITNKFHGGECLKTNSHLSTQEIPDFLRNLKVHYCVHNNASLNPILSKLNPVHTLISYFFNIFPSVSRSSSQFLLFILSRVWVNYKVGFGLVIGFIDHSLYNHSQ